MLEEQPPPFYPPLEADEDMAIAMKISKPRMERGRWGREGTNFPDRSISPSPAVAYFARSSFSSPNLHLTGAREGKSCDFRLAKA